MVVTVIGLGLIGGSMAIDMKNSGFASKIIGVDSSKINAEFAVNIGFVDMVEPLLSAISKSSLVIIATPSDSAVALAQQVLDNIEHQVVIDVCSTKVQISEAIKNKKMRRNFVLTHPMAGTEFSGPWAAKANLFTSKVSILCDVDKSDNEAVLLVEKFYDMLNMSIIRMSSLDHDIHAAYVSHISHISSFALALTVLEKEKDEKQIFNLASGGFDSTVRLAKSSAAMWTPIFNQNKNNLLPVIDTYIEKLNLLKNSIEQNNFSELKSLIERANKIKRVLK